MADTVVTSSELLEKKAIESIEEISGWIEQGKDFVVEQAPLVVQEMIHWGMAECVFWIGLGSILCTASIVAVLIMRRWIKSQTEGLTNDERGCCFIISAICAATFLANSVIIFTNIYYLCFIYFAPRLYVMEELARIMGKFAGN